MIYIYMISNVAIKNSYNISNWIFKMSSLDDAKACTLCRRDQEGVSGITKDSPTMVHKPNEITLWLWLTGLAMV